MYFVVPVGAIVLAGSEEDAYSSFKIEKTLSVKPISPIKVVQITCKDKGPYSTAVTRSAVQT